MNTLEAIFQRRTIRKFKQTEIPSEHLYTLVDAARLAAFGGNVQPLRFAIITDPQMRETVFSATQWAAYLPDGAPKEGERPMAYILVYADQTVKEDCGVDAGAAVTNILLAAQELGLGSCWIGSLKRVFLRQALQVPEDMKILYAVALGYPAQQSCTADYEGSWKYYLDAEQTLHVPKLSREEVLLQEY